MGFGASGATAIIFLGLLVGSVTLYTTADATLEQVDEAADQRGERLLDRRNVAINVTEATYEANQGTTIRVENTGSEELSVNETTVLVNNSYRSTADATVVGAGGTPTDLWMPGETLELNYTDQYAPNRVTVATEYGVTESRNVTEVS